MPAMSRLFVSYGHESDAHRRRVLELARRLRADGIEVVLDEDPPPSAGWIKWMEQQVEQADHILVIPGPHYLHGFRQHGAVPSGARYEGMLISAELERCGGDYRRFLVGLYDDCARVADLPAALYSCPSRF
ncbi:MAG TPA: toll/interleukin-1 receptor domain-containing protein, partial [Acetobacteraceae bacterium]|nr:toll/interleukin-1 receptor domain-containing protein [Acetobacteraceae bacterium]